jgi:hypothetical protein
MRLFDCSTGERLLVKGVMTRVVGVNRDAGYIWLSMFPGRLTAQEFEALGATKVLQLQDHGHRRES